MTFMTNKHLGARVQPCQPPPATQLPPELHGTDINLIHYLAGQHTEEGATRRLERLVSLQHILQYSMQANHSTVRFSAAHAIEPEDDAFTFSLKSLIRKLCREQSLRSPHCSAVNREAAVVSPSGIAQAAQLRRQQRH